MTEQVNGKINSYFRQMLVKKEETHNLFSEMSIPAFVRDWIIHKYSNSDGTVNVNYISEKTKDILPKKAEWNRILDCIINGERVTFLARISIVIDINSAEVKFCLPDYDIKADKTIIIPGVWQKLKKVLLACDGTMWGLITIGYLTNDSRGYIALTDFKDFRPYDVDINYYKKAREAFSIEEWIEIILGAMDYDYKGFLNKEQSLKFITRLLPFVEKRLNIIELAPKGTGKSYVYSNVSKYGWLNSGGIVTRAKLFYDMNTKKEGIINFYDVVALDEVSTIKFSDTNEMQGALKGYLESGSYAVGNRAGSSDAGMVLLGNMPINNQHSEIDIINSLPSVFKDSAIIDRFHGFVKGWELPRMNEDLKVKGFALNSAYFSEIMHELRKDLSARQLVEKLIFVPENADTRDTNAVKKLTEAFLKLLFPHWNKINDVDYDLFEEYCLQPAIEMRKSICSILQNMDTEYCNKDFPNYMLKTE